MHLKTDLFRATMVRRPKMTFKPFNYDAAPVIANGFSAGPLVGDKRLLRTLHELSVVKSLGALILDWAMIVCAGWIYSRFLPYYIYPLVAILIGSRQQA